MKKELFKVPIVGQILRAWRALPLDRNGRDMGAFRQMLRLINQGRTVCVAGEGTRSNDGVLQPFDASFVGLVLSCARENYPVHPIAVRGTLQALPRGAWIPKRYPIEIEVGQRLDLSPWETRRKPTEESLLALAQYSQDQLADLLPVWQRPLPGSKPLRHREEYLTAKA